MKEVRSLAAAQTVPVRGDVSANVAAHLRLLRAAADEGVEVVVFPELSITGYELDLADELAFSDGDPRLAPFVAAAASSSMTLVVGAPVRVGALLHIGAFIVQPDGAVGLHTKRRLGGFSSAVNPGGSVPPPEDTVFQPGDLQPLVRLRGGTAAVGVCAEALRESHAKQAADRGARTYLTSHFGIPLDVEFRASVLSGHAEQHSMAVVFANYGGPTGGLPGGGRSAIWSERGELLAALGPAGAGIVVASESDAGWRAKAISVA